MAAAREGWKNHGLFHGPGIPAPSGPHKVGCTFLMHKFEDDPQSLLVRLFYPCQDGGNHQYTEWITHRRYLKGYLQYSKVTLAGLVSSVVGLFIDPKIPALWNAPLDIGQNTGETSVAEGVTVSASDETAEDATSPYDEGVNPVSGPTKLPVIVFSHGLGAMSLTYSGICADVASHGYLVASVEHRDRSACVARLKVPKAGSDELVDEWLEHRFLRDGEKEFPLRNEQVKKRATDARRALDLVGLLNEGAPVGNLMRANFDFGKFKGRLDLNTAGIMGHSFGGATTIQTLSEDQRFKCGVCFDTWMLPIHKELYENGSRVQQPLIFINCYHFQWKENIQQMTAMTKPPNEQGISTSRILTLIGTNHYYQTDALFVYPQRYSNSQSSELDINTAHGVNMDITHAFLKRHLLLDAAFQGPIPNLDGGEGHSEHILFGSNVDISEPKDHVTTEGDHVTTPEADGDSTKPASNL